MRAYYEGLGNNVDVRKSVPSYLRHKSDMEKFCLIDYTLEDDNLLPSTTTPVDINSQPLGHISPLSPTVATEKNQMSAKELESTVSGSMERSEGKTPPAAAVKPSALCTVSISDAETVLQGREQELEDGSRLSGIHERCQELSGAERPVRDLPGLVGKKSRSARAAINLRRSLAWDKAFSTSEGVLDIDELPFVTKTPRKQQDLHTFHIPENLEKVSPSPCSVPESFTPNPSAVDSAERIPSSPGQGPIHPHCLPCDLQNSPIFEDASSKGCSASVAPSQMDTKTSKLGGERSVSVGESIKANALKGTRLRLPSSFTGKKGKVDSLPQPVSLPQNNFLQRCKSTSSVLSPTSASSAFSKKVSSVSKKVKDTLGKVLPGGLGGSAKHVKVNEDRHFPQGQAVNSPGLKSSARSKSSKSFFSGNMTRKNDGQGEKNNQEVIPAGQVGNGNIVTSLKSISVGTDDGSSSKKGTDKRSSHYTQVSPVISRKKLDPAGSQVLRTKNSNHVNGTQNSKGLSSGLRLPSPKIGFFDTHLRPGSGQHASTLPERVLGAASDNSNYSRKGLPPRPQHGLSSGRAGKPSADSNIAKVASQLASSGIPSAPHLRPFGELAEGLVSSVSAPTSPRTDHLGTLSAASHQAVAGRQLFSQINSDEFRREFDRVDRTQLATVPEFRMCSGNEIFEMSVAHPATETAFGSGNCHPGMAKSEIGRSLGHDSRLKSDSEMEDSSKFREGESSVKDDVSCFAKGKLVFEDSAKAVGNHELSSEDFRNIPGLGKRKTISSDKFATGECVQDLGHPEKEYMERDNDTSSSCTSRLSTSAVSKPSSQTSPVEEHTPSITPAFKRLSYTKTVTAENIPQNTPDSFVRSSSPIFASNSQGSKHPLAVNVGLLNGINKRTSLTPSRKERGLQVVFDQHGLEVTSGQENTRVSDGQLGSTHVNKPQQRKSRSDSSHSPFQSEAYKDLFSEERIRALEAAGQETLLKKSGAVQHSPPNKISPNRNPWSPVKRSGQQLGPFDCTKKYANAFVGQ